MEDSLDLEHKKILLEDRWGSRFNALKRSFEDNLEGNKEDVMAEIVSIKEMSEKFKINSLITQIDTWMRGDRIYDLEEYLTCQEVERIIRNDRYYSHKEFVHEAFLDDGTFSTILAHRALIDRWIAKGLASLEGCPWTPPPRWDYSYQHDCNDFKSSCIKVASLRRFLSSHKLPVPAAIFPNDPQNTSFTLDRIEQEVKTLREMRKREKEVLELKELRRKSEQCGGKVQEVAQNTLVGEAAMNEKATLPATAGGGAPEVLIARLREEGVQELRELAARVDKDFPGLSDAALGELLPARPGTSVSWKAKNSQGRRLRGKK
ncbi:hypothetical protein K9F62_20915 [Desulfovibrio sp. JY]|nr:hypothetical protein K9F62_20915 [Desulfovibrio sp. JY]